jgi:hypothetical protein
MAASSGVTARLADYSPEFQTQAAAELESYGPPCPHDVVIAGCSAVKRMVIDYKDVRDQTRAITSPSFPFLFHSIVPPAH